MIVRHSRQHIPLRDTSPASPPLLRVPLPGTAHHRHGRLDFLGLEDFLFDHNLDRRGLRDVCRRGRAHDVGSRRSDTTRAVGGRNSDLRRNRVVLGVGDGPGLGRNLDGGLSENNRGERKGLREQSMSASYSNAVRGVVVW